MTKLTFGLLALLYGSNLYAGDIVAEGAWTRATLPQQEAAMVYMSLSSKRACTLIGVSSKVAKTAEMHKMEHSSGMMKMHEVKSISLPANERMELNMHGYHLVLNGLKAPLVAGTRVPLTLTVEMGDKSQVRLDVQAEVRPLKEAQR